MIAFSEVPIGEGLLGLAQPGAATPFGARVTSNPLTPGWRPPDFDGTHLVLWSGTLADDLFEPHPPNWLGPGREALDALIERVLDELPAGRHLLLRPHCRHVLSDVPSCRRFLADHEAAPIGLALAPHDLLEDGMLPAAEDHLRRIFEGLGAASRVLFVDGMLPPDGPPGNASLELVAGLVTDHVAPDTPQFRTVAAAS
ncbi:MAG: hypothetical protein GY716_09090 [bacterium]|nr:hypothetical protein [bacterium]